jgi:MYXO-CTERM domain-containing protein
MLGTTITTLFLFSTSAGWTGVGNHWDPGAFPIPYCLNTNAVHTQLTQQQQHDLMVMSIDAWRSTALGGGLSCTTYDATPATYTCAPGINLMDGQHNIFFNQNWANGSQVLGVTHQVGSGQPCGTATNNGSPPRTYMEDCTFDADIELNDTNLTWDDGGNGNNTDLASILTHEYGHFIGLGHCNDNMTCMLGTAIMYAAYAGGSFRVLQNDDITGACALYPGTPGGIGYPCTGNSACTQQICVNPTSSGYCTQTCGACPQGYKCAANPQNAGQQVCVRDNGLNKALCQLCQPLPGACANNGICAAGLPDSMSGHCVTPCPNPAAQPDGNCPTNYTCAMFQGGGTYCIPKSSDCNNPGNFTSLMFGQACTGQAPPAPQCGSNLACAGGICSSPCTGTGQGSCPAGYGCAAFQDQNMQIVHYCAIGVGEGQLCIGAKTCLVGPCLTAGTSSTAPAQCYRDCSGNPGVCNDAQSCMTFSLQGGGSISVCIPPGVPPLLPDGGVLDSGNALDAGHLGSDGGSQGSQDGGSGNGSDAGNSMQSCACDQTYCCDPNCSCDPECNCDCDKTSACDKDPATGKSCACDPDCTAGCPNRGKKGGCECVTTPANTGAQTALLGLFLVAAALVWRRDRRLG